jgi:hypothetical protein
MGPWSTFKRGILPKVPENPKKALDKGVKESVKSPHVHMKNSPLTTILLGALAVSAVGGFILCWLYISNTRNLRALNGEAGQIQQNRVFFNSLLNDVAEYSKTHPAIGPLLEPFRGGAAAPATPAASPATKAPGK